MNETETDRVVHRLVSGWLPEHGFQGIVIWMRMPQRHACLRNSNAELKQKDTGHARAR